MSDKACTKHNNERAHLCYRSEPCPWCEIERLRAEVAQEKRWGLEAHERAGGVEERLRAELAEKDKRIEELKLEMEPWVRAMGLLTTMKPDLEIDAEHPGLMAREIFKWVKEKDKRIDELEEALSKSIMHQKELDRCAHITTEQIDKRWKYLSEIGSKGVADGYEQALYDLGFRRCEECGGSGRTYQHTSVDTASFPCHSCHGHGWKVASDE